MTNKQPDMPPEVIELVRLLTSATDRELTQSPWWAIVRLDEYDRPEKILQGIWFSRESAETALRARRYDYGDDVAVWCFGAAYSWEYARICELARELRLEIDGVTHGNYGEVE